MERSQECSNLSEMSYSAHQIKTSYSSINDIPSELWRVVGSKLDLEDRVHFRAVSKSWRSLLPPPPHPPSLIFDGNTPLRHFMCLGKQETYSLHFPQIHGAPCIGSAGNCLITLHPDETIRLTNLFSRAQTHLPHNGVSTDKLTKLVLSSLPWEGQNCTALAIEDYRLTVVRPGDTSWTKLKFLENRRDDIGDITFYNQKFYAVNDDASLYVCDVGADVNPPTLSCIAKLGDVDQDGGVDDVSNDDDDEYYVLSAKLSEDDLFDYVRCYLVECSGELLLVFKYAETLTDHNSIRRRTVERLKWIKLYSFDFTSMEFIKLKSLGEHSLFIGYNGSCVSVLASDYSGLVRENCIYFLDSKIDAISGKENHDIRVLDLEEKRYYKHTSTSSSSPPVWIVPT